MNMKTEANSISETVAKEKFNSTVEKCLSGPMSDRVEFLWECMIQFKSPSLVSQQLTPKQIENIKGFIRHRPECELCYEAGGECTCGANDANKCLTQLSVSPDAQKDEYSDKDAYELAVNRIKSLEHQSEKKSERIREQGKEIEELKEKLLWCNSEIERQDKELTSKESDVKRAVWALEKLNIVMRDDSRTNKEPFGKNPYEILCTSKIIIEDALSSLKGNK